MVESACDALERLHRTRVELDLGADDERIASALDAIATDEIVTDVVVYSDQGVVRSLHALGRVHRRLLDVPHVTALRIRSRLLVAEPQTFTNGVIDRIGSLTRLDVVRPLRVEVEVPVLHPTELGDELGRVVRGLRRRGVSMYAVIPLLMHLNDEAQQVPAITSGCRRLGIEVHHLVLAGHPVQCEGAAVHPVPVGRVVDLGTALRRDGSGRELPRLIVQTALGECDFGLTGEPLRHGDDGSVAFRLPAGWLDALREVDPAFRPPDGVTLGPDGRPIVPVHGLTA